MMNFLDALNAHALWKMRLNKYLSGESEEQLDPEEVCKDNLCALGQWIYGNENQLNQTNTFEEVRIMHGQFHQTAAEIIRLIHAGEKKEAEQLLTGEYAKISHILQSLIRELAKDLDYQS